MTRWPGYSYIGHVSIYNNNLSDRICVRDYNICRLLAFCLAIYNVRELHPALSDLSDHAGVTGVTRFNCLD